uniref:LOC100135367 protein n=1 Tax=Xenopus tropicalis TaxID=8364 RepID=F6RIC9_XENTR|nr:LOC100135367 protein [Xenopus tropicalis]
MNVIIQRHGTILTIGINRPEARNAVNPETASQLVEAFNQFENDPGLTAAVLHGIGGNFCAGFDLKAIAHSTSSLNIEQDVTKGPGPMGPSRMQFSKPVIAAVSGYAVAGGLELSLLADLRVVEKSATFGVFCRRFGLQCAIELAQNISSFPQKCMLADRASAYNSTFDASEFADAMQYEFDTGAKVLVEESVAGAKRFSAGEGRKGKL